MHSARGLRRRACDSPFLSVSSEAGKCACSLTATTTKYFIINSPSADLSAHVLKSESQFCTSDCSASAFVIVYAPARH